ncbi:MAG: hypothetical protein K6E56_04155 [Lachnospiraceae bacterium]|nr:hypothetical protein [Lachnospiraceae bacterium]
MKTLTKKLLAVLCVLAMAITLLPADPVAAATAPKFKKTYSALYENGTDKGSYTYTIKNVSKGMTVKWYVTGPGKKYVSVKKSTTYVTSKTVSNTVKVNTKEATAAKNKKIRLKAKVYGTDKKLKYTISTTAKIKVKPTAIQIVSPSTGIYAGTAAAFTAKVTPGNATSKNVWSVKDSTGADCSSYITSDGKFTAPKPGTYTITLEAKIGSKVIKKDSKTVTVTTELKSIKQKSCDAFVAEFSSDVSTQVKVGDFAVKNQTGSTVAVDNIKFSEDGKIVTINLKSNLVDDAVYSVSYGTSVKSVKASVKKPRAVVISTTQVTVGKETPLEYGVLDENGVDVTKAYPGRFDFKTEIINGHLSSDNKLYMQTVGKTANIEVTYTNSADSSLVLTGKQQIVCVAMSSASKTQFTMTTSSTAPDFTSASFKENRKVYLGKTYYAYFNAMDKAGESFQYTSVKFESSDPDVLICTAAGKLTPVKAGAPTITVTVSYGDSKYTYSFDVTVADAVYIKSVAFDTNVVEMSNASSSDYKKYINLTAKDQYGEDFSLTDETVTVEAVSTTTYNPTVNYDTENNRLVISASSVNAGTYGFKATVKVGKYEVSGLTFTVVVKSVPTTGTSTFVPEIDKPTVDVGVNEDTDGSRYVTVRLAEYKGGVFVQYVVFTTNTIKLDGKYYNTDLTSAGQSSALKLAISADKVELKVLDITDTKATKAATGAYAIEMEYYNYETTGSYSKQTRVATVNVKDAQECPKVDLIRTESKDTCSTALELAKACLTPSSGVITECEVTGETKNGSEVSIAAGDQINIKTVTVTVTTKIKSGKEVTSSYKVTVGKTLKNAEK